MQKGRREADELGSTGHIAEEKVRALKSKISRMEQQRLALEKRIQILQSTELRRLPRRMGFENVDQLILALANYASPKLREGIQSAEAAAQALARAVPATTSGTRAIFPPELKESIRQELLARNKSVARLSREYGPSHSTIMTWKREWKLTRPRSRKSQAI